MTKELAPQRLTTPLSAEDVEGLRAGDRILLSGIIYTARDAAHRRFAEALAQGEDLPIDLHGQVLYYVGPTPSRPGMAIGAAGPTTASRMDRYTPELLAKGVRGTIGKGRRSAEVRQALCQYRAVYLGAIGGLGALLAQQVRRAEVLAYPDLGAEAVHRLEVEDFPLVVIDDAHGGDLYELARAEWVRRP